MTKTRILNIVALILLAYIAIVQVLKVILYTYRLKIISITIAVVSMLCIVGIIKKLNIAKRFAGIIFLIGSFYTFLASSRFSGGSVIVFIFYFMLSAIFLFVGVLMIINARNKCKKNDYSTGNLLA